MLRLFPDRGFAFLGMSNTSGAATGGPSVFDPISSWASEELLGIETAEPEPIERWPEDLAPYVGSYEEVQLQFEVRADAGRLVLEMKPKGRGLAQAAQRSAAGAARSAQRVQMTGPAAQTLETVFIGDNEVMVAGGPQHGTRGEFVFEEGKVRWLRWRRRLARRVD